MVVYIHAHDRCLPQWSGFGDLHSLWYVVIDEAMEIVILKYCPGVFFSLFFTMYLTTTLPQKTPTGMFLNLPNVHIFHIFTFTVYDILVGMWDLTYVWLTKLSFGSVPCPPGARVSREVSVSLPPSDRFVESFFPLHRENGAKVNLFDAHMSLSCEELCSIWGYVALTNLKPDTVEQLKVHVESKAPLRITHCCSICDHNCHIWGYKMPTYWVVSIRFYTVCYNSCESSCFLRWWV